MMQSLERRQEVQNECENWSAIEKECHFLALLACFSLFLSLSLSDAYCAYQSTCGIQSGRGTNENEGATGIELVVKSLSNCGTRRGEFGKWSSIERNCTIYRTNDEECEISRTNDMNCGRWSTNDKNVGTEVQTALYVKVDERTVRNLMFRVQILQVLSKFLVSQVSYRFGVQMKCEGCRTDVQESQVFSTNTRNGRAGRETIRNARNKAWMTKSSEVEVQTQRNVKMQEPCRDTSEDEVQLEQKVQSHQWKL